MTIQIILETYIKKKMQKLLRNPYKSIISIHPSMEKHFKKHENL